MKTSELTGAALDWAVAKAERRTIDYFRGIYKPSTDWVQGGPIIEREEIEIKKYTPKYWSAKHLAFRETGATICLGETPLIAAMRCYVASKLGDEIELPEGLR